MQTLRPSPAAPTLPTPVPAAPTLPAPVPAAPTLPAPVPAAPTPAAAAVQATVVAVAWAAVLALVVAILLPSAPMPALRLAGSAAAGGWVWPLEGSPTVVRGFDPPPQPWMAGHRGVDLVADSATVRAAGAGIVRFAGVVVSRPLVSISHDGGLVTTYEPVEPAVGEGEWVRAGQVIGTVRAGHPGCPAPVCLHWGLRRGETYLDPLVLMGTGRVRLLPLTRRAGRRRGGHTRPRCCRSAR